MFCKYCGTKVEDNVKFCRGCGKSLIAKEEKNEDINGKMAPVYVGNQRDKKKANKITIIELVVLVVVLISCFTVYYQTSTAVVITEKYLNAYATGDYEQMYNCLEFEEEDKLFVSKESFVTAGATCYQEQERPIEAVIDMEKTKGGLFEAEVQVNCESSSGKYVETIQLERQGLKWKVVESKLEKSLLQPIEISVPTETKVVIDKINISNLVNPETKYSTDTYQTKALFGGNHLIECTMEEREDTSLIRALYPIESDEDATSNYIEMAFTDEMYKKFENMAVEDFAIMFEGIINNQDVREIELYAEMYEDVLNIFLGEGETYSEDEFYDDVDWTIEYLTDEIQGYDEYTENEIVGFKITDAGYTRIIQEIWEENGSVIEGVAVLIEPFIKEKSWSDGKEYVNRSLMYGFYCIKINGEWKLCLDN